MKQKGRSSSSYSIIHQIFDSIGCIILLTSLIQHPFANKSSISFTICRGSTLGLWYDTTCPSASIRNLAKFQGISLTSFFAWSCSSEFSRQNLKTSCEFGPFTSHLSNRGHCPPYKSRTNAFISALVPGSWFINWLQGKARISKP